MSFVGTPGMPDGFGSSLADGSTRASGNSLRSALMRGREVSRMSNRPSGPARKSFIASFWMATVEYSRHRRCLAVAFRIDRTMPSTGPSWFSAATTRRLRRWK